MMDSSTHWDGHDPTLSSASQDDFQQFLDLSISGMGDDVGFNFQDFAPPQHGQIMRERDADSMDTTMSNDNSLMGLQKHAMMQEHMPMAKTPGHSTIGNAPIANHAVDSPDNSLMQIDAQIQYLQLQRQQQQQRIAQEQHQNYFVQQNRIVPPTPNSIEMHSGERQYYGHDQQQRTMYDTYQMRLREQELAFTPLVSPAVTPLETHFNLPEYTIPGAYFSPLSSPALHAQNEYGTMYGTVRTESSVTTSPTEMNLDLLPPPANPASMARKGSGGAGRKSAPKPRISRVRQSPIVKPQRRKMTSTTISSETLSELVEPALQSQGSSSHSSSHQNISPESSSEYDSVSPEHLSDMAPPPLPPSHSVKNSPYLNGQNSHPRVQQIIAGNGVSPATPASLMRIARGKENLTSPSLNVQAESDDHLMEGFSLPEAANPHQQEPRVEPQSDGQTTPTVESTRTPGLQPLPSTAFSQPPSVHATPSPHLKPQITSGSANGTPAVRKTPKLAARGSQQRQTAASVHASPALLPRISPSIKPMVRGSSLSDDTASLLLATKSNYQNILEGTHLPGVSYPSELSTNLTSKRTSHKIAEQGRRNRINSALQEIATLLPSSGGDKSGSGDADGEKGEETSGKGGQSSGSKASTVEQAIEYIKQLKSEVEAANKRAEEAEKKLQLKCE